MGSDCVFIKPPEQNWNHIRNILTARKPKLWTDFSSNIQRSPGPDGFVLAGLQIFGHI